MTNDDLDHLLIRYFSGDLSADERVRLERWIAEDPARAEEIERLRGVWEASASPPTHPDVEAALGRFRDHIESRGRDVIELPARQHALPSPAPRARRSSGARGRRSSSTMSTARARSSAWRIAAAIAVLLGGGLLWRAVLEDALRGSPEMQTYTTARGQRATLTLADGSTVTLNAESTVDVPTDFGRRTRDIQLQGEAYFDVAHDSDKPFRVRTGGAVTEVLGTKFNVRARPEEEVAVQVAVIEGRVALGRERDGASDADEDVRGTESRIVLAAGDLGRLDRDGQLRRVSDADVEALSGWTVGRLAFEQAPLDEVFVELGRWFGRFALSEVPLNRFPDMYRGVSSTVENCTLQMVAEGVCVQERIERYPNPHDTVGRDAFRLGADLVSGAERLGRRRGDAVPRVGELRGCDGPGPYAARHHRARQSGTRCGSPARRADPSEQHDEVEPAQQSVAQPERQGGDAG